MSPSPRASAFVVTEVPGDLRAVAVTDEGLGNTAWVLALDGRAVVVDPERDPSPYVAAATALGVPLSLALETHLHADFVTGSRELAALGASVVAPALGAVAWPHVAVAGGDEVPVGRWRLRALATPGHTPEHMAYLLVDRAGRPRAAFSGGSLLVGGVARTDLIDPARTDELARSLWASINHQLLALPDDVAVFPTHGSGSFCSAAGSPQRWTTVGAERRSNPLLAARDEDEFVRLAVGALGSYPPYFLRLREVNRRGPRVYGDLPPLRAMTAGEVERLAGQGAAIIDVRPVADYARRHVAGSLANALRPQFGSWTGWLVADPSAPLVFVTDDHTDERELVRQCLNVGYENLAGTITVEAWEAAGLPVGSSALVSPGEIEGRPVIDVRQHAEFAAGHVPGARHVELGSLAGAATAARAGAEGAVVMCGHGERAATAASVLERAGHRGTAILAGGPEGWAEATGRALAP
ncbi:MAG: rhodanese-like domain-containing protein [Actinomycetota bacterium]